MSLDFADRSAGDSMYSRSSDGSATASGWPADVDLDAWYQAERSDVDDLVKDALDLSVWSLEARKQNTSVYVHCKNNEKLSYSVRAVARVTGTVANVIECVRSLDSVAFRQFAKLLHSRVFLDSEVLYSHSKQNREAESLALKWVAFSNGKKTLGKGKEFCIREYCTVVRNHRQYGTVGVCKFDSYDGVGARYAIRARPDTFSLTVLEQSSIVVSQTPDDGILNVTLTLSMRKARSANSVSSGVKALSMRLAQDLCNLQKTVQHILFQPAALASKREWVSDNERSNCSLCVQSFGMLRRKHHCRVCGEVVCSSCTVFKVVNDNASADSSKIRVCKACLGKSTTTEVNPQAVGGVPSAASVPSAPAITSSGSVRGNNQLRDHYNQNAPASMPNFKNITLSTVSTSSGASTSSDESRRSDNEMDPLGPLPSMPSSYRQQTSGSYSSTTSSMYSKGSSSSFSDLDINPAAGSVSGFLSPRGGNQPTGSPCPQPRTLQHTSSSRSKASNGAAGGDKRTHYFNEDFREICMLAMQTMNCAMAGIRTDDLELVNYLEPSQQHDLPRSLPTFRRIAARGKPCIVLDVSADKRIAGEKRSTAKLQFFVGIPLIMDGEVIGDLCVADRFARDAIDYKAVEVLMVLGKTVTQYMTSHDYLDDLAQFKTMLRKTHEAEDGFVSNVAMKEVAF